MTSRATVAAVMGVFLGLVAGCSPSPSPGPTPSSRLELQDSATPTLPAATIDPRSVVGQLSPDLPAVLAEVPEGATVSVSKAEPAEGQLVVAVALSTPASVDEVISWYDQRLQDAGFTATDPVDGQPTATRTRIYMRSDKAEMLTLTVVDQGSTRVASIGGTVNPDPDGQ